MTFIVTYEWIKLCDDVYFFCYLDPGPNEDESWWEFKLSLSFGLKLSGTLSDSRAPSSNLNPLKF